MSGPITPPLEVTEVDGSPDGRPITKIVVSNGDLSISGRVATIDTSGTAATPGGSTTEIQYNNAGAFGGDAGFTVNTAGGGDSTVVGLGGLILGDTQITTRQGNDNLAIQTKGTGEIHLLSSAAGGATFTDSTVAIISNANTDEAYLKFRSTSTTDDGGLMKDGNQDIILSSKVANKDIDLQVNGTGVVEVQNTTTDNDTTLSVKGNGTGDAYINLSNATKSVEVLCDTNNKLKVKGGVNSFVFDVSSGTGGVTFPDGTTQTTAASGGGDGMLFSASPPSSGYDYDLSGQSQGSQGNNLSMSADTLYLMPFTVPTAISAANLSFGIASGTFSGTFYIAIYSSDSDNLPDSPAISTTGDKTITFSSTVSLSADTLYYACISWDGSSGSCSYNGGYYEYGRSGLPVDNTTAISTNSGGVITYSAAGTPPATITTASLVIGVRGGPKIRLGV